MLEYSKIIQLLFPDTNLDFELRFFIFAQFFGST
jgi:hypothetical protein